MTTLVKIIFLFIAISLLLMMWVIDGINYDRTVNEESSPVLVGSEYMQPREFDRWLHRKGL